MTAFDAFPDAAWLRIFHAERPLTADEVDRARTRLDAFVAGWQAHDQGVTGAWEIVEDRFVLVAADERAVALSGCSKDSVVGSVRQVEAELGVRFLDAPMVCYRAGDGVRAVYRDEFRKLAAAGEVTASTTVFDETITTVGDLRAGRFELPAGEAWHARAWDLQEA